SLKRSTLFFSYLQAGRPITPSFGGKADMPPAAGGRRSEGGALSTPLRCRARRDCLRPRARPFQSQAKHRRKKYGHGVRKACSHTIDEEVAPNLEEYAQAGADRRDACRRWLRRGSVARQSSEAWPASAFLRHRRNRSRLRRSTQMTGTARVSPLPARSRRR